MSSPKRAGQTVGSEIDLGATRATGSVVAGPGRYDLGLYLGECAGHPMFTCTSPDFVGLEPNAPSDAYRAVVVAGLAGGARDEQSICAPLHRRSCRVRNRCRWPLDSIDGRRPRYWRRDPAQAQ